MKKLTYLLFIFLVAFSFGQKDSTSVVFTGRVIDAKKNNPIQDITIVNKTKSTTSKSNENGEFQIKISINDQLLFTHIGYNYNEISVTKHWINNAKNILLTEKIREIETVLVTNYNLTGYLEIDTKLIPVNENYRFNIEGLNLGYEPGMKAKNATSNLLNALSNPIDLVYSLFNNKEKEFKNLINLKNDKNFSTILSQKKDRETIALVLNLNKMEIEKILEKCNYSRIFIASATDLQVVDALATYYNDYKVLKKN